MVLKFLGIGKKSGFFLEAPPADSQSAAKANPATESIKPAAPEQTHVEVKAVLTPTVEQISKGISSETPSKVETKDILAPAVEQISKATSKVKKTLKEVNAEKKAKADKGGADKNEAKSTAPAPKPEPTVTNFATTLQVNNTPRRRPGPSLDIFKDMAKQVNSRK